MKEQPQFTPEFMRCLYLLPNYFAKYHSELKMVPIIAKGDFVNYHFLLVLNLMNSRKNLMNSLYLNLIQQIRFDEVVLVAIMRH